MSDDLWLICVSDLVMTRVSMILPQSIDTLIVDSFILSNIVHDFRRSEVVVSLISYAEGPCRPSKMFGRILSGFVDNSGCTLLLLSKRLGRNRFY